jgi:glutamine synthetase type III
MQDVEQQLYQLGASEAPPAIISVYLGSQLEDVFNQIRDGRPQASSSGGVMRLGSTPCPKSPSILAIAIAPLPSPSPATASSSGP